MIPHPTPPLASARGLGRASGKAILLGEHAVVYGIPALVTGLGRGAVALAEQALDDSIVLSGHSLAPDHELHRALGALREKLQLPPQRLVLELEIPAGSGLGASAALGVASARALAHGCGRTLSDVELLSAVQAWEEVFHGNPSGVDAAAACGSHVLRFVRGQQAERIQLRSPFTLCVAVAAPPASTKEMVQSVAKIRQARPDAFERVLEAMESLVQNATVCLRTGDMSGLGKLMDLNQMLLASWMVSTSPIERACERARKAGALGAKLTGSGGGGCVIALAADDPEPILAGWQEMDLPCFACQIERRSEM